MENIRIRLIRNKGELSKLLRMREIVFIDGQKVPRKRERDGLENEAVHFIVLLNDKAMGCARIRFINKKVKLERIVIMPKYQRKGIGYQLVNHLVRYSIRKGVNEIYLHGQVRIKKFYEDCGFKARGDIFMDSGMQHYEFYLKPSAQ